MERHYSRQPIGSRHPGRLVRRGSRCRRILQSAPEPCLPSDRFPPDKSSMPERNRTALLQPRFAHGHLQHSAGSLVIRRKCGHRQLQQRSLARLPSRRAGRPAPAASRRSLEVESQRFSASVCRTDLEAERGPLRLSDTSRLPPPQRDVLGQSPIDRGVTEQEADDPLVDLDAVGEQGDRAAPAQGSARSTGADQAPSEWKCSIPASRCSGERQNRLRTRSTDGRLRVTSSCR